MPLFSAAVSSLIISPFVSIIDLSIIRSQMLSEDFKTSIQNNILNYTKNSKSFIKPNLAMFGIYFSTYGTANLCEKYIDNNLSILLSTSIVNLIGINLKDTYYSKLYNKNKIYYPLLSKSLFCIRDSITILANFVVKKDIVKKLEKSMNHNKAEIIASFLVPSAAQIVSTPIHIYAIDKFMRKEISIQDRIKNIRINYKDVLYGRILRTIPAFCIGGFINDMLKE
jgi:hypothetical protein